jgi:predicted enzyme related to lactoylglutathione lyase
MIRLLVVTLAAMVFAAPGLAQQTAKGKSAPAPIVFFDISGPDLKAQGSFYKEVFGWDIDAAGRFNAPIPSGAALPGTLRADPTNKVIYLGVEDINKTLAKITSLGGKIVAPRFAVPGAVILALFNDPAGNAMGLVELKDGKPVIP